VVIPILIVRNARPRRLRIELLWVRPLIFIVLMGGALAFVRPPLDTPDVALMIAALAIGCALGWLRGRSMRIDVHPETHDLTARASPIGLIFIFGLLALRYGIRGVAIETAPVMHLSVLAIADALVLMAVAMMVVQGVEMWLRARRLLADAQAANLPKGPPPMPKIIT